MCWSLFLDKVAGIRPAHLSKTRVPRRYFPVNFAKFVRKPFLQNTSGRLILKLFDTFLGVVKSGLTRLKFSLYGPTNICDGLHFSLIKHFQPHFPAKMKQKALFGQVFPLSIDLCDECIYK